MGWEAGVGFLVISNINTAGQTKKMVIMLLPDVGYG